MYTVAFYNFKGGAFKTTGTHVIACGLAQSGYRVLIVDTDPQAHSTQLFGLSPAPALYNLMVRDAPLKESILKINPMMHGGGDGTAAVLAGNDETAFIPMKIANPRKLQLLLQNVSNYFDYCLIDTSPTPSLMSVVIYLASDAVLYPTKCEALHIDGLNRAMEARHEPDEMRRSIGLPPIEVVGILPAIYRGNTLEHSQFYQLLLDRHPGKVLSPIGESILWAEASRKQRPVFDYAPDSKPAKQARRLVNEFVERTV